jgi:FdhE protein
LAKLKKACDLEVPFLQENLLSVDADLLVEGISNIAAAATREGMFSAEVGEAFTRVKWDRVVAASKLDLAGSKPNEWLEYFCDVLIDDGMDEKSARLATLLASMSLKAQLEEPAMQMMKSLKGAGEVSKHPLHCPVCGCDPTMAHVGGSKTSSGRGKVLVCPQCATVWDFERVRCARCGMQNQAHLHYFNIEGDDAHRIATCDECGSYIRTLYSEDNLAPCSYEVEDVVMARLEAIAQDPAYRVASEG